MERVILHCDLNSFFASVELLDYPQLRQTPVAVCGDPASRHGIILAKNEPAKRAGVVTAQTVWQAKKLCPELVLLAAHHDRYEDYSRRVNAIYEQYTDLVEPFGIDESWLDVTGTLHLFGGDGRVLADTIRARVREELGLTLSVGVSYNKVFAKLGSDYKKPDATTVIRREDVPTLVWPLPVGELLFVGHSVRRELERYGVTTIGQLAAFDPKALEQILGKQGVMLHHYANGTGDSPVRPAGAYVAPKSVGNGMTFPQDLVAQEEVRSGVTMLAHSVARRLRRHGLKCLGVQVMLRDPGFHDISRRCRLDRPVCTAPELVEPVMELIRANRAANAPIRAITITALHLVDREEGGQQLDLFEGGERHKRQEKRERLEQAMDGLWERYGAHIVGPASTQGRGEREEET